MNAVKMNRPKQRMKTELNNVIQRYRIENHLSYDKALQDVCNELQRMKSVRGRPCALRTASEWQMSLSRGSRKRSHIESLKRALGWRE